MRITSLSSTYLIICNGLVKLGRVKVEVYVHQLLQKLARLPAVFVCLAHLKVTTCTKEKNKSLIQILFNFILIVFPTP